MTETLFFMTKKDSVDFSRFLIDEFQARFALDNTEEPTPYLSTEEEMAEVIENSEFSPRFFVLSKIWQLHPLISHRIDNVHMGWRYFISQKHGGPAFDFRLSNEDTTFIRQGWFSDYSWYITDERYLTDHSLYQTFDRPVAMTLAHSKVRQYLKQNGMRSKNNATGKVGPWVLQDAIQRHRNGQMLRCGDLEYSC